MALAMFDLDQTLIGGDSDFLWGEFMSENGLVDPVQYQQKNHHFFAQYRRGELDIYEYLAFCLAPLANYTMDELDTYHRRFMDEKIENILLPKAQAAVDEHRRRGDTVLVITATNRFIAAPIAKKYGIENLLATEIEKINGRYSGRVFGAPCFQAGKIQCLNAWLGKNHYPLDGATFYSDSHNDLAILTMVDFPVAVDPDPELEKIARQKKWPILSWRD